MRVRQKIKPSVLYYERNLQEKGYNLVVGVDEAGRGPLAGPVVAAAVYLLTTNFKNRVDDSKKLSAREREMAYLEIIENANFAIGLKNEKIIDNLNIRVATHNAMKDAVLKLINKLSSQNPQGIHILVDGNMDINTGYPCLSVVKGDSKSLSIAAASIIAKVTRDKIMCSYDKLYPQYGFMRHKGYPTKLHKAAILKYGPCAIHRVSFNSV